MMLLDKRCTFRARKWKTSITRWERFKKRAASFPNPLRPSQQSRRTELQNPQSLIGIARQLFKPIIRNLPPEIVARHVLDFMRFVEDHRRIFRQNAAKIVMLQRQVREK